MAIQRFTNYHIHHVHLDEFRLIAHNCPDYHSTRFAHASRKILHSKQCKISCMRVYTEILTDTLDFKFIITKLYLIYPKQLRNESINEKIPMQNDLRKPNAMPYVTFMQFSRLMRYVRRLHSMLY